MPEFIREYGGIPVAGIAPDVIHILDQGKLTDAERTELAQEKAAGAYLFDRQHIVIIPDEHSRLKTSERVVHELMHLESFVSLEAPTARISAEEQQGTSMTIEHVELLPRRIGLSIFDKTHRTRFFRDLDEAVIEELTIRFDHEYFPLIPVLQEEIKAREHFKAMVNEGADEVLACVTQQEKDGMWHTTVYGYEYANLRNNLWSLIQEIHERTKGAIGSQENIFRIFANATLTGKLIPLGRLLETTFGKGTFRFIGKKTAIEANDEAD